jgi:hypothetical protein
VTTGAGLGRSGTRKDKKMGRSSFLIDKKMGRSSFLSSVSLDKKMGQENGGQENGTQLISH